MSTTISSENSPELAAAYAHCRAIAKVQAKNFYYSFRVLPQHKSDAMCAVYAFMRKADDLADDESLTLEQRRDAMAEWTAALRAARTQPTDDPIFLALNDTQQRFGITDGLLDKLVQGTTLDLAPLPEGVVTRQLHGGGITRTEQIYETMRGLEHYCYLVASVVGLVCIRIFGYTDPRAEQLAVNTGIAFQLTNILRDIKEDLERGRIYIPLESFAKHGVAPERLLELTRGASADAAELLLLHELAKHAEELYRSGEELIPLLDSDSRSAMRVLMEIYHRLLLLVASDVEAVFRQRLSVPTATKLAILGKGVLASAFARGK